MVKLNKIYTKTGDKGLTGLVSGKRVSKDNPRIKAYGTVDEAQAILGLVRTECEKGSDLEEKIIHIERDLYVLMAELATDPSKHDKLESGKTKVNEEMINFLEQFIDDISSIFELPKEFVIPGQNIISALIDVARTVVRRAERRTIACDVDNSLAVPYLNRLSDLLWAMARWQEGESITSRSVK